MVDTNQQSNDKQTQSEKQKKVLRKTLLKSLISTSILAANPTAVLPSSNWPEIVDSWAMILERIPTERLTESFKIAMNIRSAKNLAYPLNACEILAAWKQLTKPHIESPEAAWAMAIDAMRKCNWGREPLFCDDALVRKCIEAIGIQAIAMSEWDKGRERFLWMYKEEANAFRERVEVDPAYQLPAPRRAQITAGSKAVSPESARDWRNAKEGFRSLIDILEKTEGVSK